MKNSTSSWMFVSRGVPRLKRVKSAAERSALRESFAYAENRNQLGASAGTATNSLIGSDASKYSHHVRRSVNNRAESRIASGGQNGAELLWWNDIPYR